MREITQNVVRAVTIGCGKTSQGQKTPKIGAFSYHGLLEDLTATEMTK